LLNRITAGIVVIALSIGVAFAQIPLPSVSWGPGPNGSGGAGTAIYINVIDAPYSARPANTLDQGPAINLAMAAANTVKGTVFAPNGKYYINLAVANGANASKIVLKSNVTLMGAGIGRTIFDCDDTAALATPGGRCLGLDSTGGTINHVTVRDLTISGRVLTAKTGTGWLLLGLDFVKNTQAFPCSDITIKDTEITAGRYFGVAVKGCDGVTFSHNHVSFMARDGMDCWGCSRALFDGNQIEYTNDDAITCHIDPITGFASTTPLGSGCTITNNVILEGTISAGGGKNLTIAYNQMRRIRQVAINVSGGGAVGGTPSFAVNVIGNTITDVYGLPGPTGTCAGCRYGQAQWYMSIGGGPKQAMLPTLGAAGTSGLLYEQNTSAASTSPGGGYFNVSNNILLRTLPANTTGYSDWGGDASQGAWRCVYTGAGNPSVDGITCDWDNTIITEALLNTPGIEIIHALRNSVIENNTISTTGIPILFNPTLGGVTSHNNDFDGLYIKANHLSKWPGKTAGIYLTTTAGTFSNDITIEDNDLDGDPEFLAAIRGANGTWAGNTNTYCIDLNAQMFGVSLINNSFKNCYAPVVAPVAPMGIIRGNKVYSNPTATGYNAANVGIGNIPVNGADYTNIHWDGNPNSGTYGTILSAPINTAATIPTTGTFVQGHFVWSNNPASNVLGWARMTTGAAHVSGTDWQPVTIP
jgi:hypothetical protein